MSDAKTLRVIDTGVLEGRLNIALGQAIVDAHQAGEVTDTLRFLRFPPTALIGRHQALAEEINLDYCRANAIGLARRITGGGAIFLDPGQLGWELAVRRDSLGRRALPEVARELCEAVADGISRLGVEARYRPRNDIEVEGRKISGTGGFFDGETLFYQGTVLVDMDAQLMASALRVPQAKLARHALDSAARRIVTLRELLGDETPALPLIQESLLQAMAERFGFSPQPGGLSPAERRSAERLYREEIGSEEFLAEIEEPPAARGDLRGSHSGPGGTISCYLRLEGPAQDRIRAVLITGDFFIAPPRVVFDLESRLRGIPVAEMAAAVRAFFEASPIEALSVRPEDFVAALENALQTT